MIPVYLQAGLTLDGQAEAYLKLWPPDLNIPRYQNMTEEQIIDEIGDVWRARMLLSVSFSYYRVGRLDHFSCWLTTCIHPEFYE